jgi:hypothetical protein
MKELSDQLLFVTHLSHGLTARFNKQFKKRMTK